MDEPPPLAERALVQVDAGRDGPHELARRNAASREHAVATPAPVQPQPAPATAKPSQNDALECSLSGSKNMRVSPHRFLPPFMTAALNPPPIVVELVIG